MKIEKKLTVILDEKDISNLQICFDFCNILEVIRQDKKCPKGYNEYEIKSAYELFEKLNDL